MAKKTSRDPQRPRLKSIRGLWAYALQGVMRAQGPIGRSIDVGGMYAPPDSFSVNRAGMALAPFKGAAPDTTFIPLPMMPELSAYRPADFQNPYAAGSPAGYYPFSEIGYLDFALDATVKGWLRENTAGYPMNSNVQVAGECAIDANGITGVITLQMPGVSLANHVWDYHFAVVSGDEIAIAVAGRLPRPAVGTGTLRRRH